MIYNKNIDLKYRLTNGGVMEIYENKLQPEIALLVAVDTGEYDTESSLEELKELVKSAGIEPFSTIMQKRDSINTATCVGSGMIQQIAEFCKVNQIDFIVFDCELTPTQIRNIENITNVRVIDRTMLILDIFAQHAISKEGKLQVELAQLKYIMPRLTGKGLSMSRLGGGIGTRGPGETKLETDKRHIRRRMETIKRQLLSVELHRSQLRMKRRKNGVITAALVGYTNAGKSTLMNTLTQAGVLAEDKLFATLDPTSRVLKLPNGVSIMLIDTVGLVRRLPHHLVEAFKSTLEEAALADVILNVCDASSPESRLHLDTTKDLLQSLGCRSSSIISVMNKCDLIPGLKDTISIGNVVKISAKENYGIDELLATIEKNLPIRIQKINLLIPFCDAKILSQLHKHATILKEEYNEDGISITALVDVKLMVSTKKYEITDI